MPQSLFQVYGHLVFSTHNRKPFLRGEIMPRAFRYISGALTSNGCHDVLVGGHDDHIHTLFILPKTMAPSKLIQEVKQESSKWIKETDKSLTQFGWQRGYGLFSVSPTSRDAVRQYIKNQSEHHRKMTFKEEFLNMLKKSNLDYDERYLWG